MRKKDMAHSYLLYRNLIVVGCGPHFRNRYHAVLEEQECAIVLLIDLQSEKDRILDFFKDKKLRPEKTLFLNEDLRNDITALQIEKLVANVLNPTCADGVLLCTEPKVRKSYALWALEHRLPIFMDKPPCAFRGTGKMETLLQEYEEIARSASKAKVNVVVSCERRAHLGYLWIMEYLRSFVQEEQVDVTSIDIHFANGNWVTPQEYVEQEHHPFKYGYGLLLHSGYHYIDLLTSLLSLNKIHGDEELDYYLKVMCLTPQELMGDNRLQHRQPHSEIGPDCHFGETEVLLIGKAKRGNNLLSTFSVKLVNRSLSKRMCESFSPEAEWRLRQEHLIVHLGYLASLNVISNPLKKLDPNLCPLEEFDLTLMHSPRLAHRKPIVKVSREDLSNIYPFVTKTYSLNHFAREWQLREFLQGREGGSPLSSHRETMRLLDLIYSQIHEEYIVDPTNRKLQRLIETVSPY